MSRLDDLSRLRDELREAKNWVDASRGGEWAQEWADDTQLEIARLEEELKDAPHQEKPIREWPLCAVRNLALSLMSIALLLACNASAWAIKIDEASAVHAILGEARGEGYPGMLAVAHAIRNRGHLRGVYGLKAGLDDVQPSTRRLAEKAWKTSAHGPDPTHGADHWENIFAYGVPYWAEALTPTAIIGRHAFYKVKS